MLNTMRDNFKALKWLLLLVVLTFVVAIFADWGRAGDAARAGVSASWVARVNGDPITVAEFQAHLRNVDGFYRTIYRDQYDPRALGVVQLALNQLVRERLVLGEARRVGLRVSPEEISRRITRDPSFQREGRFIGVQEYQKFLRGRGIDVAAFEDDVARELLRAKYQQLVTDGVSVTAAEVEEDYRLRNEKVVADYVLLRADAFASEEVAGDDELRAFFEARPDRYLSPERRRAAYALLAPDRLASGDAVTEAEARAYYEENRDRLYATPPQVRASHILIRTPDGATPDQESDARRRAQQILDRVRAGEPFAGLAESSSEDESNASLGGDLGFFPRGRMVPAFEEVAFSLPVGGTSDLVRTQFGFHIIRVTDRREASTRPFDEVREPIVRQLQFSRSQEALREAVAAFRADVEADPGAFDRAASRLGVEVGDTGLVAAGAPIPAVGSYPQVAQALFRTDVGKVSQPITLPQGTLFLRTTEIVPPQPLPFEEARAEVAADLRRTRALDAARRRVEEARTVAPELSDLARRLQVKVETTAPFTRGQPVEPFTPEARDRAFQLPPDQLSEPVEVTDGLLLFRVASREGFDPASFAQQRDSLERSLVQQRRDRLFNAVVSRLERASRIQLNQARLALYEGRA